MIMLALQVTYLNKQQEGLQINMFLDCSLKECQLIEAMQFRVLLQYNVLIKKLFYERIV